MDISEIRVRALHRRELPGGVEVLARGMRDNPSHVATFGADPERRLRALRRMFGGLLGVMPLEQWVAVDGHGSIVGFMAAAEPGVCRPSAWQAIRLASTIAPLGPRTLTRVGVWQRSWHRHDLARAHSHFGPVAVDAHLQDRGIGSLLLRAYTSWLDDRGEVGYLETDGPENVAFYGRHGFVVTAQADVLGVPNWFMCRTPARTRTKQSSVEATT